jgi:hypothetical protein
MNAGSREDPLGKLVLEIPDKRTSIMTREMFA